MITFAVHTFNVVGTVVSRMVTLGTFRTGQPRSTALRAMAKPLALKASSRVLYIRLHFAVQLCWFYVFREFGTVES